MHPPLKWSGRWPAVLLAGARLVLVVLVGLVLAGAPLHHVGHHADEAHGQTCSFCLLGGTALDSAPSTFALPPVVLGPLVAAPRPGIVLPLASIELLPPGRAPPAAPSVS